jgi:hypothetical protein
MSRLAEILKQEYQTKGIFAGAASALSKRSKEKMDIRNSLFGGSGLGSIIGRKVFGKGYSAINSGGSKVSNVSEAISSGSSTILQEISISTKITAKNTLALPAMARDMHLVKQNIIKMVKLQGGTPTTKAGDFFSRQSAREAAFENKYSKTTTPTKVEPKKEGGGFLGGLLSILGAVGSVFKSILSPVSSLAGILGGLGLAAVAFGGTVWKILGFLAKTKIGKILGLAGLAFGAANVMAGGDEPSIDPSQSPTGNADDGMSFGTKAAIGVAGYGVAKAGISGYGLVKQTGAAISNAKVASNPFVNLSETATKPKDKWGRFLVKLAEWSPKLYAKFGARLAAAGALAAIPIVGWIGALISLGFTLWTAYEIYTLWKKFTNEDTEESPTESKAPIQLSNLATDIVQPFNYGGNNNSPSPTTSSGSTPSSVGISSNGRTFNQMSKEEQDNFLKNQAIAEGSYKKGTVGNRHNNPGNIIAKSPTEVYREQAKFGGVPGETITGPDGKTRTFVRFPSWEAGTEAQRDLWQRKYGNQSIETALNKWVDPSSSTEMKNYASNMGLNKKSTASNVELAQGDSSGGTMGGFEIMAASASAADGRMGNQSGGGTTNNIAVQSPAQQSQNQQVAMSSPSAFDNDLAKLLLSPMSL